MTEESDEGGELGGRRLTHSQRLNSLEKWSRSHAKTLGDYAIRLEAQQKELNQLIEWRINRMIIEAKEEERTIALQARLAGIEKGIDGMRGAFAKMAWIVAGTVIPAAVIVIALQLARTAS